MEVIETDSHYSRAQEEVAHAPFEDLDNEQLENLLQETLQANDVLQAETDMFERYLLRLESKAIKVDLSVQSAVPATRDITFRKRSKSFSSVSERSLKLTPEQKCDIAVKEIEEMRDGVIKLEDESEKVLDTYKVVMEEADIRLTELKKEAYEFDRDIVKGAINERTHKIIAEKCLRYFDERMQSREALIEKLRLKNSTLKVQMKKLKLQLKQKEEMGEVLNEVDFNQLKIENQQYLERIDERNQDLLRLKLMAGNTLQVLNSYKKKLYSINKESARLKSEKTLREDLQVKLLAETKLVEQDRAQAEQINKRLRKNLTDFRVPDVMEYVQGKSEIYDLHKKIKNWERKVDIAELALKTHSKAWRVMQRQIEGNKQWKKVVGV